jgi:3-phenylpropionate/trans-cinnamate dioxygenase ferredoxin reductase subunit
MAGALAGGNIGAACVGQHVGRETGHDMTGGAEQTITIVGASLAGVSAAEELRQLGFEGEIILIGDEARLPYDRPPLSKAVLAGSRELDDCLLRPESWYDELDIDLALGVGAVGVDTAGRRVKLADGRAVAFDSLVIATGAAAVEFDGIEMDGVYTLRTADDAVAIRSRLPSIERMVVVGGGFIGAEVAATARSYGVAVTIIEGMPTLMSRVVGEEIGELCADMHKDHGVEVRCRTTVARLLGAAAVRGVELADGTVVESEMVVIGVGARPNTAWLEDCGLVLENGVVCDAACRTSVPGIVAAGDVARWNHPALGMVRVEHWDNAVQQGRAAAATLLMNGEPYAPVPYVWSDQYDRKIQVVGMPAGGDEMVVVDGSLADRRFVVLYGRGGRLTGGLAFNRSRPIRIVRSLLAENSSFEHALGTFS